MGYESGFSHEKVWGIGYERGMGYGTHLPANGIGGTKNLWGIGSYGLGEVWVKGESTVLACVAAFQKCVS